MKRRILALACMLMILVGVCAGGFTAQGATEYYQVGYSKMDINPWVDPEDPSQGIILAGDDTKGIPLSGYSTAENRIATSMLDDNGDGNVDDGDGIFTTCTVVVDPDGSMIFFFTLDAISGYGGITGKVRTAVVSAIAELGGTVTADRIMVTGSHSHTGPNMDGLDSDKTDTARCAYYQYIIDQMTQAAVNAYTDSKNSQAIMKKRELDVSEQYGYQMNWVRHVNVPFTVQDVYDYSSSWYGTDRTETIGTGSNVYGSNFGIVSDKTLATENIKGTFLSKVGTKTTKLVVDTANRQHVAEADDTLRLLTFEFTDDRDPIVLVNWRAHPDNIGNNGTNKYVSSDYVGALRYRLEQNATKFGGDSDYRVGYWQGASGNINTHSSITSIEPWVTTTTAPGVSYSDPAYVRSECPYVKYGYMLAEAALLNLEGGKGITTTCGVGGIVNQQVKNFTVDRQMYSAELKQAAVELLDYVNTDKTGNAVYTSASDYITRGGTEATFPYTGSTGGILNSKFHWNKVYEQSQKTLSATVSTEIDVLMIGKNAAFVTSACELFDRYDANQSTKNEDNDWLTLVDENTYGTPFILAYTNGHNGYISNTMAYRYNEGYEYGTTDLVGAGSYEANTAVYAEGTGEKLVAEYAELLDLLNNGYIEKDCPDCGSVEWQPLIKGVTIDSLAPGHYYLTEDLTRPSATSTATTQKIINSGETMCIDLNGYLLENEGRSFLINSGGTVNILNTQMYKPGTGGILRSYTGTNNAGGGMMSVSAGGIFNLYGGQLELQAEDDGLGVGIGGIASLTGTMNVYGGTVKGADLVESQFVNSTSGKPLFNNGSGGAIYMYAGSKLNVYGGSITLGTNPDISTAMGPCVFLSDKSAQVNLYKGANVADIYYRYNSGSNVTISGTYTGTTNLSFHSDITLSKGLDIGDVSADVNIDAAKLTYTGESADLPIAPIGTNLTIGGYKESTVAVIGATEYESFQDAVNAYNGTTIKLVKNETAATTVSTNAYVDLNGYSITGALTVDGDYTLYCKDSRTDDFTVADEVYGKLTNVSVGSKVEGIPPVGKVDGYLKITDNGAVSFHRVNLQIFSMTLRPMDQNTGEYNPGAYYSCKFMGDEKVAGKVQKFGVALSVQEMPNETNLDTKCKYSYFTGFKPGAVGNSSNGTLLKNIMKTTNAKMINKRNATMEIYGRAYILTDEGYTFGVGKDVSFKELTELTDDYWTSIEGQQDYVIAMYEAYNSIMKNWDIPNIQKAVSDGDTHLKLLVVGNSHGLDATNLLYEVFEAQKNDAGKYVAASGREYDSVTIGALYYSGANMSQHAAWANNTPHYQYYKMSSDIKANNSGRWTVKGTFSNNAISADGASMYYALQDEDWDIVVMQQMNHRAAITATTTDNASNFNQSYYKTVANYILDNCKKQPKLAWHMVWTNPDGTAYLDPSSSLSHPTKTSTSWVDSHVAWFPSADGSSYDQNAMYQGIVNALKTKILSDNWFGSELSYVLPSAVAIEYAQDVLGCTQADIYRDYTHMNDYGRLMVAYTWWAELMGYDKVPSVNLTEFPAVLHHSSSTILSQNAAGNYVLTAAQRENIRTAVNYALSVNDPKLSSANAYQLP